MHPQRLQLGIGVTVDPTILTNASKPRKWRLQNRRALLDPYDNLQLAGVDNLLVMRLFNVADEADEDETDRMGREAISAAHAELLLRALLV